MGCSGETPRPHIVHRDRARLTAADKTTDGVTDYLAGYLAAQEDSRRYR